MNHIECQFASLTHRGRVREHNEDSLLADGTVFAVADGMGGHEAGDLASKAVIDSLKAVRASGAATATGAGFTTPEAVVAALAEAQRRVSALSHSSPDSPEHHRSAGSTAAGVALVDFPEAVHWLVFNIGDSRVYRWRDGQLQQLSIDHSLVQEWVDDGTLTKQEARTSSRRNVITRALGAADHEVDYYLTPVAHGERILVCSDGLTSEVDDVEMAAVLAARTDAEVAVRALVAAALDRGARDNVSAIVVDVVAGGLAADPGAGSPGLDSPPARQHSGWMDEADHDTSPRSGGQRP